MKHAITTVIVFVVGLEIIAGFGNASPTSEDEKCVDTISHKSYAVSERWAATDKCIENTCNYEGKITERGCPQFKIRAECHLTPKDDNKLYPDCCPQVVCPLI